MATQIGSFNLLFPCRISGYLAAVGVERFGTAVLLQENVSSPLLGKE